MPQQPDFIVNSSPLGVSFSPFAPSVAVLQDGRSLVVWVSADTGDQLQADIRGRWMAADGTPDGEDFVINTTLADFQWRPVATVTADGKVFVAWESGDAGDGDGVTVRGRLIDPQDSGAGADFILNTPFTPADPTLTSNQQTPAVTGLDDGRIFALWSSTDGTDGDGVGIRGRYFAADGSAIGEDFLINTTGAGTQYAPRAQAMEDGRIFVTFASGDEAGFIRGRMINADGSLAGDDFAVSTTTDGYQNAPDVTGLANGGAVMVWFTSGPEIPQDGGNPSFGPAEIRGRVIGADGVPQGDEFRVNSTDLDFSYAYPKVVTLPDGHVFVIWHSGDAGDGDWGSLRGRVLAADGSPVAQDFVINSTGINNQSSPDLAVMPDGRVFVSWTSDEGSGIGATTRGTFVLPLLGDTGVDSLDGSSGQDVILGLGGRDVLTGLGGVDQIMGGFGADLISAGTGADTVLGGSGADTLTGGRGDDHLTGGSGKDVMSGGGGADSFVFTGADLTGPGDVITDFGRGDNIDLSGLDGNSGVAGHQGFTFVGGAAFWGAGQIRQLGNALLFEVDGDGSADLRVVVQGGHVFSASDFSL